MYGVVLYTGALGWKVDLWRTGDSEACRPSTSSGLRRPAYSNPPPVMGFGSEGQGFWDRLLRLVDALGGKQTGEKTVDGVKVGRRTLFSESPHLSPPSGPGDARSINDGLS